MHNPLAGTQPGAPATTRFTMKATPPGDYTLPELVQKTLGILNGAYDDFDENWFADVGTQIIITYVLVSIVPLPSSRLSVSALP